MNPAQSADLKKVAQFKGKQQASPSTPHPTAPMARPAGHLSRPSGDGQRPGFHGRGGGVRLFEWLLRGPGLGIQSDLGRLGWSHSFGNPRLPPPSQIWVLSPVVSLFTTIEVEVRVAANGTWVNGTKD